MYDKTVIYLLSCEDIFIRFFFPIPKAKTCGQTYLMIDKKFRCFEYERVPRIIFTIPCLMKECVGIFIELVWKKYRNFLFSYLLFYLFYSSLHGNLKKWKNSFGFKYPISSIVINILQLFESLRYSWSRKFANSEMLRVVNFSLRLFYINEYKVWIFGKKRRKIRTKRVNFWPIYLGKGRIPGYFSGYLRFPGKSMSLEFV